MKMFVYAIYDTAAAVYMRPFPMDSDGRALRMFKDAVQDAESEIGKHPEDFSLHRIGTWDDNKGELEGSNRECLTTAMEMVAETRKVDKAAIAELDKDLRSVQ